MYMRDPPKILAVLIAGILLHSAHATFIVTTPVASKSTAVSLPRLNVGYVPDGLTPTQWKKKQDEEKQKKESMDYGHVGPMHFVSRSLQSFQEALERGKAKHLMPMTFAEERLKRGLIHNKNIPYMQRHGSWYTGYVPDGMTSEQWTKLKEDERKKKQTKSHHFQSRPLRDFQEDLEKGIVKHLMPMVFAQERLKRGKIHADDIPYMQRDGKWDDSDIAGYVPDGFTHAQWKNKLEAERKRTHSMEFGRLGPKGFKSRSLQSFQEDLEKGKVKHLMPVMYAKTLVKKGKMKPQEVPYMQRGGSLDNSDIGGAKKMEWTNTDKKYASGYSPVGAGVDRSSAEQLQPRKKMFGLF